MSLRFIVMSLRIIAVRGPLVVTTAAALGACAEQHAAVDHESADAIMDPSHEEAGAGAPIDAARFLDVADGGAGSLLDAAARAAFCEDTMALNQAYAGAVQAGHEAGCRLDSDCALEWNYSACGAGCYIALPDAGIARYRELLDRDVRPMCLLRDEAGCGRPPNPGCAEVSAICRQGRCETMERAQ